MKVQIVLTRVETFIADIGETTIDEIIATHQEDTPEVKVTIECTPVSEDQIADCIWDPEDLLFYRPEGKSLQYILTE